MRKKNWLARIVVGVSLTIFTVLGQACATPAPPILTPPRPYRPLSGIPYAVVIGGIQATFTSWVASGLNQTAHAALLRSAIAQHGEGVNVADVTWVQTQRERAATARASARPALFFAIGIVIVIDPAGVIPLPVPEIQAPGIEGALERAVRNIAENIPGGARIAVLYMAAQDAVSTEFLTGELALFLVRQGFVVVDLELDRIRAAYRLGVDFEAFAYVLRRLGLNQVDPGLDIIREGPGLIGTVDNATAARIGQFAGAGVVLIGGIDGGTGNFRRLRLRAVDTATAQVLGMASERIQ